MISLDMNSAVIILVLLAIGSGVLIYFSWKKYSKVLDTEEVVADENNQGEEEPEPMQ
jgi:hypothetical protein